MLPYAIVTYTVDGVQQNVDDVESVPSEVSSQLQHIIERINAKAEGHAAISTQRPAFENVGRLSSVVSAQLSPSTATPVPSSLPGGVVKTAGGGLDVPAESSEANLQRVIAQINARLEAQERSKQFAFQNAALLGAAATAVPSTSHHPTALGRVVSRGISNQAAAGLGVIGSSAHRADAGSLAVASGAGLTGHSGSLAAVQPKITVAAGNMASAGGGYWSLAAGGRSAPLAVAPELIGGNAAALAGMQYPSSAPIVSASPYLRALSGIVDATGIATAVDPTTMLASQQVKYFPQSRDMPVVGAASASGLYPLQSVMPADAVGAGYTLVNSGGAVKRPLNDVMLYMLDKRPRYY